jgi:hypothetical protein
VLAVVVLGCSTQETSSSLGAPPPCTGKYCGAASGGGVMTNGSGGSSGTGASTGTGTASAITVTGSVTRIVSEDFLGGSAYTGAVTIEAPAPGGALVSVMYGGAGMGGAGGEMPFSLQGVAAGPDWVLVADDSQGAEGILSTFSTQDLSNLAPATLPVMDLGTLQMIADGLPSVSMAGGVSPLASQIILTVVAGGAPAAGVTLSGNPVGGTIVYDIGDGVYDDMATMTGLAGTIIVFNAALNGSATLTLSYTSPTTMMTTTMSVPIQGEANTATFFKGVPLN